jgi:dihydropteroate synthase
MIFHRAPAPETFELRLARGRSLSLQAGKPLLMGILNVTPDSFSDGGEWLEPQAAAERARQMIAEGASMIDVGGESSRPGADPVALEEELRRVLPIVESLAGHPAEPLISVDTCKPEVARLALEAGAHLVNDISGGQFDPAIFEIVAQHRAGYCLMHMRGTPRDMQLNPRYEDVIHGIGNFFESQLAEAARAGIARESIILDPGIGFGKTAKHNVELIRRLPELRRRFGLPALMGVSRKSFLAKLAGREDWPARDRDAATQVAHVACILGGAAMLRVHEVAMAKDAVALAGEFFAF